MCAILLCTQCFLLFSLGSHRSNNELVLPQIIMLQISRRADFPVASALSLILMVVITLAYLAVARWLKSDRV